VRGRGDERRHWDSICNSKSNDQGRVERVNTETGILEEYQGARPNTDASSLESQATARLVREEQQSGQGYD